jgi:clan AA aspartic protease
MGEVNVELTLKNVKDIGLASQGYIKPEEVKTITVTAVVDTGASTLIITEETRQKLGLAIRDNKFARMGDNTRAACQIVEPVEVWWKDRRMTCEPVVLPTSEENLLGVIPLENMDLIVDPVRQTLAGAHGDEVVYMVR